MHRLSSFLLLFFVPAVARGQGAWSLTVAANHAIVGPNATNRDDPDHPSALPFHPDGWELALARHAGPWRVDLGLRVQEADLAVADRDVAVLARGALSAVGVSLALSRRLVGTDDRPSLRASIGGAMERWDTGPAYTRLALEAGSELVAPFSRRWEASVRGTASLAPSIFRADELPEGYRRRAERRLTFALGVRHLFR